MSALRSILKINAFGARTKRTSTADDLQLDSNLERTIASKEWLLERPRTSFEIAVKLFGDECRGISDIDITMHEMLPWLYVAGYSAIDGIDSDLAGSVWVKA